MKERFSCPGIWTDGQGLHQGKVVVVNHQNCYSGKVFTNAVLALAYWPRIITWNKCLVVVVAEVLSNINTEATFQIDRERRRSSVSRGPLSHPESVIWHLLHPFISSESSLELLVLLWELGIREHVNYDWGKLKWDPHYYIIIIVQWKFLHSPIIYSYINWCTVLCTCKTNTVHASLVLNFYNIGDGQENIWWRETWSIHLLALHTPKVGYTMRTCLQVSWSHMLSDNKLLIEFTKEKYNTR